MDVSPDQCPLPKCRRQKDKSTDVLTPTPPFSEIFGQKEICSTGAEAVIWQDGSLTGRDEDGEVGKMGGQRAGRVDGRSRLFRVEELDLLGRRIFCSRWVVGVGR